MTGLTLAFTGKIYYHILGLGLGSVALALHVSGLGLGLGFGLGVDTSALVNIPAVG